MILLASYNSLLLTADTISKCPLVKFSPFRITNEFDALRHGRSMFINKGDPPRPCLGAVEGASC